MGINKKLVKSTTILVLSVIFLLWAVETSNFVWYIVGMVLFGVVMNWKDIKNYVLMWVDMLKVAWNKGGR